MSIVVFGEILWDVWSDARHIGGAPFNFAAHLAKLGEHPCLVSAVGRDEPGDEALERLRALGLSDAAVARTEHPTGACHVTQNAEGKPAYRLLTDVAYDHIPLPKRLPEPSESVLYFGSLAQRSATSARTLANLISLGFAHVFCDINLRPPFYSRDILLGCLTACTILKVSREEYEILAELGLIEVEDPSDYAHSFCRDVTAAYPNIRTVILTMDKDGSMLYEAESDRFFQSVRPKSRAVSTVGAGDSFSACYVANLRRGRTAEECQNRGVLLSDYVVTRYGAVPDYPHELLRKLI